MKQKIIIEEVISQEFEVDINDEDEAYDEVRDMYKSGKLVLKNPSLTQANVLIYDKDGKETDWLDLHI